MKTLLHTIDIDAPIPFTLAIDIDEPIPFSLAVDIEIDALKAIYDEGACDGIAGMKHCVRGFRFGHLIEQDDVLLMVLCIDKECHNNGFNDYYENVIYCCDMHSNIISIVLDDNDSIEIYGHIESIA